MTLEDHLEEPERQQVKALKKQFRMGEIDLDAYIEGLPQNYRKKVADSWHTRFKAMGEAVLRSKNRMR